MDLPNLSDCDYFKKGKISYESKQESVLIFKLKGSKDYHFIFKCPKCGKNNEYDGQLTIEKMKNSDGKKSDFLTFKCNYCGETYHLEKFKVAGIRKKYEST